MLVRLTVMSIVLVLVLVVVFRGIRLRQKYVFRGAVRGALLEMLSVRILVSSQFRALLAGNSILLDFILFYLHLMSH